MSTIAERFAELPEDERCAFIIGVTLAYRDVMDAIGPAFDAGGLTKAFVDIREQYQNVKALIAVEGVCE